MKKQYNIMNWNKQIQYPTSIAYRGANITYGFLRFESALDFYFFHLQQIHIKIKPCFFLFWTRFSLVPPLLFDASFLLKYLSILPRFLCLRHMNEILQTGMWVLGTSQQTFENWNQQLDLNPIYCSVFSDLTVSSLQQSTAEQGRCRALVSGATSLPLDFWNLERGPCHSACPPRGAPAAEGATWHLRPGAAAG